MKRKPIKTVRRKAPPAGAALKKFLNSKEYRLWTQLWTKS